MAKKQTHRILRPSQPDLDIFEEKSQEIVDIYHELGERIFNNFIDHLTRVKGLPLTEDTAFAWGIQKLNEFNLINKENVKIASLYSRRSEKEIDELFVKYGQDVYNKTQDEIPKKNNPSEILEIQLQAMADNAKADLNNLVNQTLIDTNFIGQNSKGMRSVTARNMYQHIVNQTVANVVTGNQTPNQALAETIIEWQNKNGNGGYFIDKGGHRWSFERYAFTVITSSTFHIYNEMRTKGMKDMGLYTAYMSAHPAARPACAMIQGKVVLVVPTSEAPKKLQKYPSIYSYGYGEPAGTMGINCRHYLTPFDPNLEDDLPELGPEMDGITPERAIENSKIQARQRQLERDIRHAKEMMSTSKKIGDMKTFETARLIKNKKQSAIRQLVSKHDFLHRDYMREKYFEKQKYKH